MAEPFGRFLLLHLTIGRLTLKFERGLALLRPGIVVFGVILVTIDRPLGEFFSLNFYLSHLDWLFDKGLLVECFSCKKTAFFLICLIPLPLG